MKTLLSTICLFFSISIAVSGQGIYKLWGTTPNGGKDNAGVIFSLDGRGRNIQKEYEFVSDTPGWAPRGSALVEYKGKFYGMTSKGGIRNGIIYEWDPKTDIYLKRYEFGNESYYLHGSFYTGIPEGTLVLYNDEFYGYVSNGGYYNEAILFRWNPETNEYTELYRFYNAEKGRGPIGNLSLYNGKIYGATWAGGLNGIGVLFEWDLSTNTYTKKLDFDVQSGGFLNGSLILLNNKFYGVTITGGGE